MYRAASPVSNPASPGPSTRRGPIRSPPASTSKPVLSTTRPVTKPRLPQPAPIPCDSAETPPPRPQGTTPDRSIAPIPQLITWHHAAIPANGHPKATISQSGRCLAKHDKDHKMPHSLTSKPGTSEISLTHQPSPDAITTPCRTG